MYETKRWARPSANIRFRAPLAAPEDGQKSRSQIPPAASREHSRASRTVAFNFLHSNNRLKRLVANQALDIAMLKQITSRK